MNGPAPRISIIVPVYNCRSTISKCMESLCAQDHPRYEIIVVDDGSSDGTAEICESFEAVRVIRLGRGGPSRARNVGIGAAGGEFVAFTDGDCVAETSWLKELERGFVGPEIAGVGGDQKSPVDECEFGRRVHGFFKLCGFAIDYVKSDRNFREVEHNASCNSAYRKSVVEEIGGFDESLFPCEDMDLDLRLRKSGRALIYNPAAEVSHYRPRGYGGFARMMKRYGSGEWHLVRKHGFNRMLDLEPIAVAAGLAALLVSLIAHPSLWPVLLLPLPISGCWIYLKTRSPGESLFFLCLLLITAIFWNWGFFTGMWYRPVK